MINNYGIERRERERFNVEGRCVTCQEFAVLDAHLRECEKCAIWHRKVAEETAG